MDNQKPKPMGALTEIVTLLSPVVIIIFSVCLFVFGIEYAMFHEQYWIFKFVIFIIVLRLWFEYRQSK